jgi:hypothetical protein
MTDPFEGAYLTEDEICGILRVKKDTLANRISCGTDHPPFVVLARGIRIYPKRMFLDWIAKKQVIWEVKSAAKIS